MPLGITHFAGPCICEDMPPDRLRAVESMIVNGAPKRSIAERYDLTRREIYQHIRTHMDKSQKEEGIEDGEQTGQEQRVAKRTPA